jgi:hypothetical protein
MDPVILDADVLSFFRRQDVLAAALGGNAI